MSVELSPSNVYGNLGIFRKETDVNVFSGEIYENYPKPQKEENLKTNGSAKEPEINVPSGKGAKSSSSCLMLLGLGILCLLLVVSISIISWVRVELVKKEEKLMNQMEEMKNCENQTKKLNLEKIMLKNVTEEIIRRNDELNRMRKAILAFENFPVKDFCPEKKCQPCQKDWIPFQGKCYLFQSNCNSSMNAQQFCQAEAADLVFVDNLQELEFLKNHANVFNSCPYNPSYCYYYRYCEYGKPFGYWAKGGLLIPEGNIIDNWSSKGYSDRNRFICEGEEMPWPK